MEKLKNEIKKMKAITLIALIITIVVLIILAGVVINLSLGENGLFQKAKYGAESYTNATKQEETEIASLEYQVDNIANSREQIMVDRAVYEQLLADVAKLKSDVYEIQNNKMEDNKFIIESQTHTSNANAVWTANEKTGYKPIAAKPTGAHVMIPFKDSTLFCVYNGNIVNFAQDSAWIKNTSVTAYVVYMKIN